MSDGDVVADERPLPPRRHMDDDAVLNVGPGADPDDIDVAPHNRSKPDAGVRADFHVADDDGGVRDEGAFMDDG